MFYFDKDSTAEFSFEIFFYSPDVLYYIFYLRLFVGDCF